MTSDMGDMWNARREARRQKRAKDGLRCEGCLRTQPKREPSILLPGQTCRVCGYRRPHPNDRKRHPWAI